MQRFIFMGFVALVAVLMTFRSVASHSAKAAPLKTPVAGDKTLLDDATKTKATAEVQANSSQYLAALLRGDGKAVAAFWTTDGVFIDNLGNSHPVRELIAQEFSGPDPKLDLTSESDKQLDLPKPGTIHMITRNVALERGSSLQTDANSAKKVWVDFLAIWVKQEHNWYLNYIQETTRNPTTSDQEGSNTDGLNQLEWMVGHWVTQGTGPVAQFSVSWSKDKNFLLQKFVLEQPGQKRIQGEQRIAWNPVNKAIRSWIFRADGGFAEATWNQKGDTWIVKTQGVQASGAKTSALNLWAPDGFGRCWFKSVRMTQMESPTDEKEQDEVLLQFRRVEGKD